MKTIKAIATATIKVSHEKPTNITEAWESVKEARQNRVVVLEAALTFEVFLNQGIAYYFFESPDKRAEFEEIILHSDWCSFAAKRKLASYIINKKGLLEGEAKQDFDEAMRKVMSYRNAWAHGRLSHEDGKIWLNYFEGGTKKKELSDGYLTEMESFLEQAVHKAADFAKTLGAPKARAAS